MCLGFEDRQQVLQEAEWARARQIGFWMLSTMKLKKRLKGPQDLMLLPSERKTENKEPEPPMTNAEGLELFAKWNKKK